MHRGCAPRSSAIRRAPCSPPRSSLPRTRTSPADEGSTVHVDDDTDYQDPDLLDYQGRLARWREEQGVVRLRFGDRSGLAVLRHADVTTAFREDARFSK